MQQEATMVSRQRDLVELEARGIERVLNGAGATIECVKGALWITQEGDERDVTLAAGERFYLDRNGLAVIYGLEPAAFLLSPAARQSRGGLAAPADRHAA
jgi:hypothetical protein